MNQEDSPIIWYVDEAGDPTLFAKGGKVIAGTEGCSRFFIMGKLEVRDRDSLESDIAALRAEVLADPYFHEVPSLQPERKRTALMFHAKDDPAEVRYRVFQLLRKHDVRFFAVVRDKFPLVEYAQQRKRMEPDYRYKPDGHELYDELTRKLFERMHGFGGGAEVVFAKRGVKPRTHAFRLALDHADQKFEDTFGIARPKMQDVKCAMPYEYAGLQAVDYYLWALQRFYERGEERYLDAVRSQIIEVQDLDAPVEKRRGRKKAKVIETGVTYNEKRPLNLENRAGVGRGSGNIG